MTKNKMETTKTSLLEIIEARPKQAAVVTRKWLTQDTKRDQFVKIIQILGEGTSLLVMDWISNETWAELKPVLIHSSSSPDSTSQIIANQFIKAIIEESLLPSDEHHETDPFSALRTLDEKKLNILIPRFDAESWALLQCHWTPNECLRIYRNMDAPSRRKALLAGERLKKIPVDSASESAVRFGRRIRLAIERINNETYQGVLPEIKKAPEVKYPKPTHSEQEKQILAYVTSIDAGTGARLAKILKLTEADFESTPQKNKQPTRANDESI